mmetsp:Transcript_44764/g.113982  ORF Transcript_44764/g.113982 Transcript_44764/m.113982 type:complete len:89 (+) Transcript_44764:171-437(+)
MDCKSLWVRVWREADNEGVKPRLKAAKRCASQHEAIQLTCDFHEFVSTTKRACRGKRIRRCFNFLPWLQAIEDRQRQTAAGAVGDDAH